MAKRTSTKLQTVSKDTLKSSYMGRAFILRKERSFPLFATMVEHRGKKFPGGIKRLNNEEGILSPALCVDEQRFGRSTMMLKCLFPDGSFGWIREGHVVRVVVSDHKIAVLNREKVADILKSLMSAGSIEEAKNKLDIPDLCKVLGECLKSGLDSYEQIKDEPSK